MIWKETSCIDEIRNAHVGEEVLYSAMEDFYIDIMIGARGIHLDLPRSP